MDVYWVIGFNRSFDESDLQSWNCLLAELQTVSIDVTASGDKVSWGLEKSGTFPTRSLYRCHAWGRGVKS